MTHIVAAALAAGAFDRIAPLLDAAELKARRFLHLPSRPR